MHKKQRAAVLWGASALWYGIICLFSAQNAEQSSRTSSWALSLLVKVWEAVFGGRVAPERLHMLESILRQCAHGLVFLVLAVLLFFALRATFARRKGVDALWALALCGVLAAADEAHQYFVPGRAMELSDWLTDMAGAAVGLLATLGVLWWLQRYGANRRAAQTRRP